MLKSFGVSYVIIGHSERRHVFLETDNSLTRKWDRAETLLVPIMCVGETLQEHEAGKASKSSCAKSRPALRDSGRSCCDRRYRVRTGMGHRHRQNGDARASAVGAWLNSRISR